jgi:hypothetical protein
MTANAESRYQHALQFAAGIRRRAATAALKKTYAASVTAVAATTPAAISGSMFSMRRSQACLGDLGRRYSSATWKSALPRAGSDHELAGRAVVRTA